MWYLKKVNQDILDEYVGKLKNGLAKRIKNSNMLTEEQKNVFTDGRLEGVCQNDASSFFTNKAPTFTSQGFVMSKRFCTFRH